MKTRLTFFFIIISICVSYSQKLKINGTIRNSESKEVCNSANIRLQTPHSVSVQRVSSDAKGHFSINNISAGSYQLVISGIGYTTQTLDIPQLSSDLLLEDILLHKKTVSLAEVTVSASTTPIYMDKKLIFPTAHQVKVSNNGLNLLQQLMLPKIKVNQILDNITLIGNGALQLRINGVEVQLKDIKALQPTDIIRVEYYDNPGLRYRGAEVVIDYIVRRPTTGGSIAVDGKDAFKLGQWGTNALSAKINHKKSEFALNYTLEHRNYDGLSRDNVDLFRYSNGSTLKRIETGISGNLKNQIHDLNTSYTLTDGNKRVSTAKFRLNRSMNPHYDFKGTIYNTTDPDNIGSMIDNTKGDSSEPTIEFYHQENLKNNQLLVFNLIGTYYKRDGTRTSVQKDKEEAIVSNIQNGVDEKKYSYIAEAIYEKKINTSIISFGLRHTQSVADNTYRWYMYNMTAENQIKQALSYAYGELKSKANKIDYTLGVGVTRSWIKQDGYDNYVKFSFNPRLTLQYNISNTSLVRLNAEMNNVNPSLTGISAVEQSIDAMQKQRGNPNLKPYNNYTFGLTYETRKGIFSGNVWAFYDYRPNAIMSEKYWENDVIIQTWDNQKSWQRMAGRLSLGVEPLKNMLDLRVTQGIEHFLSKGNTYSHTYTSLYTSVDMTASYKNLSLVFSLKTNCNSFYGETLTGDESVHFIMLQYRIKNLSFTTGVYNPFTENYKTKTENWSHDASSWKTNYIKNSSSLFVFGFTYNFSFGRKIDSDKKRIQN